MANHGPAYGDLAEMLAKREAGYDKQLEGLLQNWIESRIGEKFPDTFAASLKDGVRLCKLINVIRPGACKAPKTSKMPFVQMENITNFLAACKNLGVAEVDLFVTVDLFEAKNMLQVQNCLDKLRIRFDGGEIMGLAAPTGGVFEAVADGRAGAPTSPRAGAPVQQQAPAPVQQQAPAPQAADAPRFCPECGTPKAGNFCAGCGFKF